MAKRRRKARRSSKRSRRSSCKRQACCPIIRVKCRAGAPGGPKMCSISAGKGSRRMSSDAAGKYIGKMVRAQTKRRCNPLVKRTGM